MQAHALKIERPEAPWIIEDSSEIGMRFNVMPDRPVEERFHVKQYRVWHRYVEATFDRSYWSSMAASPNHLIFLTALAHTQKLLYLAFCREFGFDYDPAGEERLKLWPTRVETGMPKLYSNSTDVLQSVRILEITPIDEKAFKARVESQVEDAFHAIISGRVYLI